MLRALEHGEAAADLAEQADARRVRPRTDSSQPQLEPSAPSARTSSAASPAAPARPPSSASARADRAAPHPSPYPMERQPTSQTFYVERHVAQDVTLDHDDHSFVVTDAEAPFDNVSRTFYLRKKREADEIKLSDLTPKQQALFVCASGSDATECNNIIAPGPHGTPPVKVWRGAQARKLREEY